MSLVIGGVAFGATIATAAAGAVVSYGVNSLLSGDGSTSSGGGSSGMPSAQSMGSSSIQNSPLTPMENSEAAKTYSPTEQMDKWSKIFNSIGNEKDATKS